MMELSHISSIALYLSSLVGSISFVWQTIIEFQNGATSYTETQEAVSLNDIPTIVICLSFEETSMNTFPEELSIFPITYGKEVVIHATIYEKENQSVALLKDQHVQTVLGIDIHLSEMVLMRKPKWQCYKITSKGNVEDTADIQNFRMQFSLSFPTANKSTFSDHADERDLQTKTGSIS